MRSPLAIVALVVGIMLLASGAFFTGKAIIFMIAGAVVIALGLLFAFRGGSHQG